MKIEFKLEQVEDLPPFFFIRENYSKTQNKGENLTKRTATDKNLIDFENGSRIASHITKHNYTQNAFQY